MLQVLGGFIHKDRHVPVFQELRRHGFIRHIAHGQVSLQQSAGLGQRTLDDYICLAAEG